MAQTPPNPPRSSARQFVTWVWAGLLIIAGAGFVVFSTGLVHYSGTLLPLMAAGTGALSLPFIARWLTHRDEWWAALTAWVFLGIALLLLVMWLDLPYDQITGALLLLEIAVPFMAIYVGNRKRWWALIPSYVLMVVAALLVFTIFNISLEVLGAMAVVAAALPFGLVYLINRQQWWAIVPAAALGIVGIILLIVTGLAQTGGGMAFWIILNGALAVAFFALYLAFRRFDWALWIAVGFVLAAVLAIWVPQMATWGVPALVLGLYIAFKQIDAAQKAKVKAAPAQQAQAAKTSPPPQQQQQPSAAAATPPPAPKAPAQTAPSAPGPAADREATAGFEARGGPRVAGQNAPPVEFRPLDPFKTRRDEQEDDEA